MPKLDKHVRIAEAAEYFGVHHNTLRNWGHTGKIPEYRHTVNNYRLFKVSDLGKLVKMIANPSPWLMPVQQVEE